jgi:Flp pilus assembly protein TadG
MTLRAGLVAAAVGLPARRAAKKTRGADRGSLSLMIVVLFVALAALAGIVVDGGAKLTGDENAAAIAEEAARAGATSVDASRAYATGSFAVDQQQAVTVARDYLSAAGYRQYTVAVDGPEAMRVTVRVTEPTRFLSLIGIDSFTCTGTATASLVTGVTGPS